MNWAQVIALAAVVAWVWWVSPLSDQRLGKAFNDMLSELKARRLAAEARRELAERRGQIGPDA